MARPTKQERNITVHDAALAGFNRSWSAQEPVRTQAISARRFAHIPGAQWEGPYALQFENKPKPEINKIQLALQRLFGEYRNNRIAADFVPKDGSESDELADLCDGLYRADCQDSCAEEAHDNAFDEGVSGGMGAWRLVADYENPDNDNDKRQRIRFEPIYDADGCVFFDVDARRYDKSDAKEAWVLYPQTVEAFKDEWGEDPASWPKDERMAQFDWVRPNLIYLAEYYRVEHKREAMHVFVGIEGEEVEYTEDELDAYLTGEGAFTDDADVTLDSMIGTMTLR
ncbi:MAG: portal protein, partial [Bosea sp. (in: a-proteobacteria)]